SFIARTAEPALAHQKPDPSSRTIKVDATPEAFRFDVANTAVIVVGMQNDFGAKGGMFDLAGIDISGIRKVIEPTAGVLAVARSAGIKVVYLKMAFLSDLSDLGAPDSPNHLRHLRLGVGKSVRAPNGTGSRILIRDTWNTEIVSDLKPQAGDDVIYKHRFSGFYQTDLDLRLRNAGIKHLVFTGCTTSVCVEATLRDAMFRDYRCLLLEDCMSQPALGRSSPGANH